MSIRHLDQLLDPRSVAVIGASKRAGSVGAMVWRNISRGAFRGPRYAVNPKYRELEGVPVVASVADLPQAPELAVICTPPATVPQLIAELAARGTRAAVVVTAGLDAAQRQAMLDAARPSVLRILGPNCIGLLSPHIGLNASFAQTDAQPGPLALVSQSGALMTAMLDWATARGIGYSHFISLGDHADVDVGDLLDYLASDSRTRAILLYLESIEAARKFMSAARAAARNKPVIVVKAGRSASGQRAAASHTGRLAGSDIVVDAAIRRAGMLRVDTMEQLFDAAETLARFAGNRGSRLAVLTNGGGAGVLAADAAARAGVELCELGAATIERLDAVLPANWSRANPVDIIGDAPAERYVAALQALDTEPCADALLLIHAPTAIVPSAEIARALLPLAKRTPPRLLSCWFGADSVAEARTLFQQAGVASYSTPEDAVRAFAMLLDYRRNQEQLMEAPPAAPPGPAPDVAVARALIESVLASGRDILTEPESKAVLQAFHVPVVETRSVALDPEAAVAAAAAIGYPVALKILSAEISHKSDLGGVVLNLGSDAAVRSAAQAMLERIRAARPAARLEGYTVQSMVRRAHAQELIVGASIDPVFGPVILFGQGGTAVEVIADHAVALPPLNVPLARALVESTRVARLLKGFRDTPPVDAAALHGVLVAVSQLLAVLPEVAELDINPLVVDPNGAIALDARIRVARDAPGGAERFAIRPYPGQWVETLEWHGETLTVRPIRPEDEAQHLEFLRHLDPEDIRMRVFYSRRSIERSELARLTQIDYDREMAFIATEHGLDGERTLGAVRAIVDPDNHNAEFGIIVRSDLKRAGLGRLLLTRMIDYLRQHGTRCLVSTVLGENERMRRLAHELGFTETGDPRYPDTREIRLELQPKTAP
jgi:acetyltransferase